MITGDRTVKIRILALACLGFLMSVKSDRYFPLPENLPEPVFQTFLFPYTCFFFTVFIIFLKPAILGNTLAFLDRISAVKLTAAIVMVFEAMTIILLFAQNSRFASFGYDLNIPVAVILFALIEIALVYLIYQDVTPILMLYLSLAVFTCTYLLSIVSFPLHSQRSDMLPLIVSGCRSFLEGVSPYGFHSIPHHLIFTYLPGMWIAYLPAVASGFDPRIINLICIIISALVLAHSIRDTPKTILLLLPVFLLTPYLQYRHEIYLGVIFLVLSIFFALCIRNRWLLGSAAFGYALSTYQFAWILFPFGVITAFRKSGIKKAIAGILISVVFALAIILPFFLSSPDNFIQGIYGHWLYVDVPTVNLSYLVSVVLPWDLMIFIQGTVIFIILAAALRKMDPDDCWGWMAGALLLFIALNRVIEVYFYLMVLLLLVMHGISTSTASDSADE